ncbi:calcium/sodium antiporter [Candidatus Woesearchaeota archaeon]|nr:calcium/sodium antiporter [Candidatus Woesearchaeota archaeon]
MTVWFHDLSLLMLGLIGLVIGTHLVVRGALDLAEHYKLSNVFIGLTILAIGTDLPELIIAIVGSINRLGGTESSGLILGDAIGSSIVQISIVLGIAGLFGFFTLTKKQIKIDGSVMIGSIILLFLVGYDGNITRTEGIFLIIVYLIYYLSLYREEKVNEKIKRAPTVHLFWDIASVIGGMVVVLYTSNIVVENSASLAISLGISQALIGVLIASLGTSLPELSVAIGAAFKEAPGLSIGNLIGSNIFDLLIPIGTGAAISGLVMEKSLLFFDIPALLIISLAVLLFFIRKKGLQKKEAAILIGLYVFYAIIRLAGFMNITGNLTNV